VPFTSNLRRYAPGMPPGMMGMMPGGAGGAPFDMSKIKEMLEDPSIKDMAKQIAEVREYVKRWLVLIG
jgi:hypothetical protein